MQRIIKRFYSKYKKMDQVIDTIKKKDVELTVEGKVDFKPFINSVYEKFGNIKPYSEFSFDITQPNDVPIFMYEKPKYGQGITNNGLAKILNVAIFGPTNSGKSLLMNKMINRFISAVSNKSFTTDKTIMGLKTDVTNNTQLVFRDLPGFQNFSNQPRVYGQMAFKELDTSNNDVVMIVLDSNKKVSKEILNFINLLNKKNIKNSDFILVLNKMDLCFNRRKLLDLITYLEGVINVEKKFYVSAETDYGIPELINFLTNKAKEGEWIYSSKYKTDQSEIEIMEQIIKSIIYNRYYKEFPYEIQTKVTEFVIKSNRIYADVQLNCERPIHIDILIGTKGQNTLILKNYIQKFLTINYNKEVEIRLDVKSGLKVLDLNIITDKESIKYSQEEEITRLRSGIELKDINKSI